MLIFYQRNVRNANAFSLVRSKTKKLNMKDNKYCPLYVDYVRECLFQISPLADEMDTTLRFCISGDYETCPFFQAIHNPSSACEHFKKCCFCERYKAGKLDKFVELTDTWCLNNFTECARHKIWEAGDIPEPRLHPAGHYLTE